MNNFCRSLDLPLINCEIEKNHVISEISGSPAVARDNLVEATTATGEAFQISNAKVYVPVVTLFINNNFKFVEHLKQVFRRTISLNKYRTKITTQLKNNNLHYMTDPLFGNINRLFVLSFKNGKDDPSKNSFDDYYMLLIEIKYFNVGIGSISFFQQPVKKAYERLVKMSRNDIYTTEFIRLFVSSNI